MKKVILLLVSVVSIAVAQAQVQYGVKGGFNISNIGGSDVSNNKARILYHLGVFADAGVADHISIRPELYYSAQGAKFTRTGDDLKYNLGYLNLPVLVKYNFSSGFYGAVGPQLGFLLSAKAKVGSNKENIKNDLKKVDFAWVFGIGYQPHGSKFGVDGRFNLGLSKLPESGGKAFNRVIQLGIFYVLGSTGK